MSKRNRIKWRNKDIVELQRIARNFNAKINRIAKKTPEDKEFLPEKVSVKDLKTKIETRQDYNRYANSLKRFSKKGSEKLVEGAKGLKITQYELEEAKIKTRIVNARRTREKKALDLDERKGVDFQTKNQGLNKKPFSINKTRKEWEKFVESLEKESRSLFKEDALENYKTNYLNSLRENLGQKGYEIAKKLEKVDSVFIYENSVSNPILSIDFVYDPLEFDIIVEAIEETWGDLL